MSQKINSNAMRLGISKTWKSRWYKSGSEYVDQLHEDLAIREFVKEALTPAGLDSVNIMRSAGSIEVVAVVARPGVAIGRGGSGIDTIVKKLKKLVDSEIELKVIEVPKPDISAPIIAGEIASGLLRRMPPKLLALNAIEKARSAGAKGIRIWIGGRINGASQARTIKHHDGPVPLHTLKANIDFAKEVAATPDLGKFGIKVWVNMPDTSVNEK